MSHLVGWRIPDKKVADEFAKVVKQKYGNKKGALGIELQKAMINHINLLKGSNEHETSEQQKIIRIDDMDLIIQRFEEKYPHGSIIKENCVNGDIAEAIGKDNHITIKSKKDRLIAKDVLLENEDGTFIVFPDRIELNTITKHTIGELDIPKKIKNMIVVNKLNAFLGLKEHGQIGITFKIANNQFKMIDIEEMTLIQANLQYYEELGYENDDDFRRDIVRIYGRPEDGEKTPVYIHRFEELNRFNDGAERKTVEEEV